jgi:hypothetical protein
MIELTVRLTEEQLTQIAERTAELLPERSPAAVAREPLLTVGELAEMLAVAPDWVRRHQADLGAFRLSEGGGSTRSGSGRATWSAFLRSDALSRVNTPSPATGARMRTGASDKPARRPCGLLAPADRPRKERVVGRLLGLRCMA